MCCCCLEGLHRLGRRRGSKEEEVAWELVCGEAVWGVYRA